MPFFSHHTSPLLPAFMNPPSEQVLFLFNDIKKPNDLPIFTDTIVDNEKLVVDSKFLFVCC